MRAPAEVSQQCPDDLVVECDGAGNVAEREAWLLSFSSSASIGCGRTRDSTDIEDAEVVDLLRFEDFADLSGWTLNNATGALPNPIVTADGPVLRLTDNLSQSGSAFTSEPVTLADDASFDAFFAFRITDPIGISDEDGVGADGLVFVVQSVSDTAGGLGGGIGYEGIPRSIGVEFDTWNNGAGDSFSGNHVGIDVGGSVASVALIPVAGRMNDGLARYAWVEYDGSVDLLEVRLADTPVRPAAPLLTWSIDVAAELGTTDAFVGFTSGTGAAGGDHDILSLFVRTTRPDAACGVTGAETVLFTSTDNCDDTAQCDRTFIVRDTTAPAIEVDGMPCDRDLEVVVGAEAWDGAPVDVLAVAWDACDAFASLSNDLTGDGGAVSGRFPCGASLVRIVSEDACGNASECRLTVRVVPPAPPTPVGAALRLRKDAAGTPELDWSLAGADPAPGRWVVLRVHPQARIFSAASAAQAGPVWRDVAGRGPLLLYDVRSLACDGSLSAD